MIRAKSHILCVFEGAKREVGYFKSMLQHFFDGSSIIHCCYGNDLYELAKLLTEDDNEPDELDIFEVIKEHNTVQANEGIFENYTRDDFSQVYLFFDFEYHDDKYNAEQITKLVELFNEETEVGKLFVSYPMVEAIRDIPSYEDFYAHTVNIEDAHSRVYKALSTTRLRDFIQANRIDKEKWNKLVCASVEKANYITNGDKTCNFIVEQSDILISQLKQIEENSELHVLSSYPMFLHNQFPFDTFNVQD